MRSIETISKQIADGSEDIRAALPADVRDGVKTSQWKAFIRDVRQAVELYLARPVAPRRRRKHRPTAGQKHPSNAHRPRDAYRRGMIADLFDAYMTLRADNLQARGFNNVANAVFEVAGITLRITNRDRATLRARQKQIAIFNRLAQE